MKLLTKTSFIFITISLFVFFISGIFLYIILKKASDRNINKELYTQFEHITRNLPAVMDTGKSELYIPFNLYIKKTAGANTRVANGFELNDTILLDPVSNSYQIYRKINGYSTIGNKTFQITVYKSLIQSDELLEQLIIAITSMTILLILGVFFVTRFISERIWSDFFRTLETIKKFDLSGNNKVHLPPSDMSEFNELNNVLNIMIARIYSDFKNLKEFTENITHEMQTPLAIIKSKIELFLQSKDLSEEQALILNDVSTNITRLTKLNKGLVLLSRIENEQFTGMDEINITELIIEAVENMSYISESKNLQVENKIREPLLVSMNKSLAEILVNNLIKNAFIHTPEEGKVAIEASDQKVTLKNTGKNELSDLQIFERFVKGNFKSNSLGIGLSLVQKICSKYGFTIQYSYNNKYHVFTIDFS